MAETLLQKAQRLGIKPAGRTSPRIERFRSEAQAAEVEAQRIASPLGQFKEFGKELGEISGLLPTGRRIAAGIAPAIVPSEELPQVVESLVGGIETQEPSDIREFADIALDLPLISLGISKNIASYLGKQGVKVAPETLSKFLSKELTDFVPEVFKTDISQFLKKSKGEVEEIVETTKEKGLRLGEKLFAEPIQKPVENVLRETRTKDFDEYVDIAKKAGESFKNATPLEVAGQRAQKALDTIQRKLENIGKTKSRILDQAVVGNKPVGNIIIKFRQELQNALKDKTETEATQKVYQDILLEAKKLGDNPQAKAVDRFIDFVQDRIYSGRRDLSVPVIGDVEGLLRPITGKLNSALKEQLPESYKNLNQQFSELVGVRDELNQKLGKEGERGGALMKRVFSPSDANTKKLFANVLKYTGVDLIDEATLARFVMETMGDARQKSLLEELKLPSLSKKGFLDFIVQKLGARFKTPEALIKRARELTVSPD